MNKYADPEKLIEFKFGNKTNHVKYVWVEPAAISLELDSNTEYKIVTHEKSFTIEIDSESQFTLWMDYSFGFKLYKRVIDNKKVTSDWILDIDLSDIQFKK